MSAFVNRIILSLRARGYLNSLSDKTYLKLMFRVRTGKKLDLKEPKTYNEKLQWLKLYDQKPEYITMVDKYRVKKYVADRIGEQYIIPTLGVWDKFDDIDFDALPDQFVLKCTHDSGGLVICSDKSKLDMAAARAKIEKSLTTDYYLYGREWPYKYVERKIIAEKFMVDESGTELKDYKVVCCGGKAKLIQIHSGRFQDHIQDFFDTQWNRLDIYQGFPQSEIPYEKPGFLQEMRELSERLSSGLPQLRVDWYYVSGQLYFGELTFFDGSGFDTFEPMEWDYKLGSWINLPPITKENA